MLAATVEAVDDDGGSEGESGESTTHDVMQVTPEHPIYVEGEGWLLAENLELGDRLRRADGGMARVLAIDQIRLDTPQPVYNFTVKGPHTYFVLDAGVLVHNADCGPEGAKQAQRYVSGFPPGRKQPTIATIPNHQVTTHSGISGPPSIEYFKDGRRAVERLANEMGFVFKQDPRDFPGRPGSWRRSHTEVQLVALDPDNYREVGVSNYVCKECRRFFDALAEYKGKTYYVADPNRVHPFPSKQDR